MEAISGCFDAETAFPPGFRFHPTDEELILYYLKRKICCKRHRIDVIGVTDVYKWDPEDLPGMSKLKTGDRQWFFFTPRDRKYPNAARSGRATGHGYWKATGKDRAILCSSRTVGVKKTLVFYRGRAPGGERTDWVMHEYTMDEDELRRCETAKEYYALYKLYKKSGPGPKNGEQYGALFREEDWADDKLEVQCPIGNDNLLKQATEISTVDESKTVDCQNLSSSYGLEEIINQIVHEPAPVQPLVTGYDYDADQFSGDKEAQSALVDRCADAPLPINRQIDIPVCFDSFKQSSANKLQFHEAPEVSTAKNVNVENCILEEDLLDFLEMNDLIGQEPTLQNLDEMGTTNLEKLQYDGFDGLVSCDLYQDASTSLYEVMPGDPGPISSSCMDDYQFGVANPTSILYLNNCETTTINHLIQPDINNASGTSYQLMTEEQSWNGLTVIDANQGCIPLPSSGDMHQIYNHYSVNDHTGATENGSTKPEESSTDSWFSSVLWSFVDSIPTTPASASESPLINRALERMSSLSRGQINSGKMNVAAGNAATTSRGAHKSRAGFICFSLLGIMCALLWVLVVTSERVMGLYS